MTYCFTGVLNWFRRTIPNRCTETLPHHLIFGIVSYLSFYPAHPDLPFILPISCHRDHHPENPDPHNAFGIACHRALRIVRASRRASLPEFVMVNSRFLRPPLS